MLFDDSKSQSNEATGDLEELCSGRFPTQSGKVNDTCINKESDGLPYEESESLNTSNLEDLCSRKFPTQFKSNTELTTQNCNVTQNVVSISSDGTQNENLTSTDYVALSDIETRDHIIPESCLSQPTRDFIELNTQNEQNSMNIGNDENDLISELLNEEENSTQAQSEVLGGGIIYDDSDEEDNAQVKRKHAKKLNLSGTIFAV